MRRALQLAYSGLGTVSPNPMVGCVIVRENRIIGEGFHHRYGEGHAEVNAVNSVLNRNAVVEEILRECAAQGGTELTPQDLLRQSTLYVTLEPCSHYGKTPPCAELIIKHGIARVVVCCGDPNPKVSGRGIEMLRRAGIEVEEHFLEEEGRELGRRFFVNQEKKRPYIILKWAQSKDGFITARRGEPTLLSSPLQQIENHSYRAQEDAIMVGTGTLLSDNPQLNARLYYAEKQPLRISFDMHGRVLERLKTAGAAAGEVLHFFDGTQPSLLFVEPGRESEYAPYASGVKVVPLRSTDLPVRTSCTDLEVRAPFRGVRAPLERVLEILYEEKVGSLIVEGGTCLLQSFIDSNLYDEIRILKSEKELGTGYPAPVTTR